MRDTRRHADGGIALLGLVPDARRLAYHDPSLERVYLPSFSPIDVHAASARTVAAPLENPAPWFRARRDRFAWIHPQYRRDEGEVTRSRAENGVNRSVRMS